MSANDAKPIAARRALRLLTAAVAVLLLQSGCRISLPRATTQPSVPNEGNAELVEFIGELAYVTAEPAYRAVYILWKNDIFEGSFDALAAELKSGEIIGAGWNHDALDYLDHTTVAYMICRACNIRSGLNWRLSGLGRYAWRELQYKDIGGAGGETSLISGGEFLGVLARAEEYMLETRKLDSPRAELGAEP